MAMTKSSLRRAVQVRIHQAVDMSRHVLPTSRGDRSLPLLWQQAARSHWSLRHVAGIMASFVQDNFKANLCLCDRICRRNTLYETCPVTKSNQEFVRLVGGTEFCRKDKDLYQNYLQYTREAICCCDVLLRHVAQIVSRSVNNEQILEIIIPFEDFFCLSARCTIIWKISIFLWFSSFTNETL